MNLTPRVIRGNAKDIPLADGSVHCVVTSPPYWDLRAYGGDPGMIGMEPTFDDHLGNLVEVFREVWRVLRDDGTLWLNYGDAYGGGNTKGRGGSIIPGDHYGPRVAKGKPKDLMMMPARVAMALQADGVADTKASKVLSRVISDIEDSYDEEPIPDKVQVVLERLWAEYVEARGDSWWLRSEIVWHKPNPMPESCTDRPTSSHEKVFLLTKKPRYFYDADAVRVSDGEGFKRPQLKRALEIAEKHGLTEEHISALKSKGLAFREHGPKDSTRMEEEAKRGTWVVCARACDW